MKSLLSFNRWIVLNRFCMCHFLVKSTGFKRSLNFIEFKQTYYTHTRTLSSSYSGDVAYRSSNEYTTPVWCAYTFHLNIGKCFIFDYHEQFAVQMLAPYFRWIQFREFTNNNFFLVWHAHRIHQIYILTPDNKYPFSGDPTNGKEVSCWIGPETGNLHPSSFDFWKLLISHVSCSNWWICCVWLYVVRIAHLPYWPLNTFSCTIF